MRYHGSGAATQLSEETPSETPEGNLAPAGRSASVESADRPMDIATIAGFSKAELTPRVRAAFGRLMGEVARQRDEIAQVRRRMGNLERIADRDALAPVLNRRAFTRELARMIAFAERYGASSSLLYFDVDDMKRINDDHGHAAGDAVLRQAAKVLLREVRASDFVGRLGGDEFGVILAQVDPRGAAVKAGALARAVASKPVRWKGRWLEIGFSHGIATVTGGEGVDVVLHAADQAMYATKKVNRRRPPWLGDDVG